MRRNYEIWWLLLDLSALCVAWIVIRNMKCMHHGVNGVGGIDGDGINNNNNIPSVFVNLHIMIVASRLTILCAILRVSYPHHKYTLSPVFSLHLNHQLARGIKWGDGCEYAWLSCLAYVLAVIVAATAVVICDYHKVVVFIFCPRSPSIRPNTRRVLSTLTHMCFFYSLGYCFGECVSVSVFVHFYLLSVSHLFGRYKNCTTIDVNVCFLLSFGFHQRCWRWWHFQSYEQTLLLSSFLQLKRRVW